MKEYFVGTTDVWQLQAELNALVKQGWTIENIFPTGFFQDVAQFAVVASKSEDKP